MYNEEDRREEQQTSGEQAPRYEHYQFHEETGIVPDRVPPVRNKKETDSFGKKAGTTVALAVLFGLVASAVFLSVSFVAGKYLKTDEKSTHLETTQSVAGTVTDDGSDGEIGVDTESGNGTVASVAQASMPSVVAITTVSVQEIPSFFGYGSRQYKSAATGSGIIVGDNDEELLIATNNHVVDGASTLSVCFIGNDVMNAETETENADDTGDLNLEDAVSARIKGTDSDNDLAVIAVKKADIPEDTLSEIKIAQIGSSEDLVVGQQVVAIGNALGYGQSVTSGWISALNRTISTEDGTSSSGLIQTDAAINPGNSGGALVNASGEVIGINSSKLVGDSVEGVGYAIPISDVSDLIQNLMNQATKTKVAEKDQGAIGIKGMSVPAEYSKQLNMPEGVYVSEITKGGGAEAAGMAKGSVITAIDGTTVSSMDDLQEQFQYYAKGDKVSLTIQIPQSNGEYEEKTVEVTLGAK